MEISGFTYANELAAQTSFLLKLLPKLFYTKKLVGLDWNFWEYFQYSYRSSARSTNAVVNTFDQVDEMRSKQFVQKYVEYHIGGWVDDQKHVAVKENRVIA